jgi:uncharacterized membrane protein YuzA (DUF378 family)
MLGPFGGFLIYDLKDLLYDIAILFGALLAIFGVVWLLDEFNLIPAIFFSIVPQIVLIVIGVAMVYYAYSKRKEYKKDMH